MERGGRYKTGCMKASALYVGTPRPTENNNGFLAGLLAYKSSFFI